MRGERGDLDVLGNLNELAQYGDSQFVEIWQAIMRRLLALDAYKAKFAAAFPGTATAQLGFQHAATAIAAFQMQAFTRTDSPFDRYLNRDDAALTTAEKHGALLFFGKAQCSSCHSRSEEHTSELQSRLHLVCRLLLEKKKNNDETHTHSLSS